MHGAALTALARGVEVRRSLRVAGADLLLRFPSAALSDSLLPALSHLAVPEVGSPELTVFVWDSRSTGVPMPAAPWRPEEQLARGDILGWSSDVQAAFHVGAGALSLYSPASSAAVFWVRDAGALPGWERAAPLRTILGWFLRTRGSELLHAGAVGDSSGGVLLAGRSGRGKSTTALSVLSGAAPLRYAGDDYVAVSLDPEPRAHSVYSSGKLDLTHAEALLPELAALLSRFTVDPEEKGLIFVQQRLPQRIVTGFPIRAVLLPAVGADAPVLRPASPLGALQEIALSTLQQMPGSDRGTFHFIAALLKRVPCYQLAVGPDLAPARAAIAGLLAATA